MRTLSRPYFDKLADRQMRIFSAIPAKTEIRTLEKRRGHGFRPSRRLEVLSSWVVQVKSSAGMTEQK
jgi:hypothetical protein